MFLRSTVIILALAGCTSSEESKDCPEGFLRDNNDNCVEVDDSDADTDSDTDADSDSDTDADSDTEVEVGDYGESVIGENDWTDVKDLSSTSQRRFLATYVGYYSLDGYGSRCTATLVAPTLIITNYHCASSSAQYQNVQVNFGYLEEENYNTVADLRDEGYSCTEYVLGNEEEDVALLKCPEEDNDEHVVSDDIGGFLELPLSNNESIELGNSIYVLHQNCYYEGEEECGWTEEDTVGEAIKKMSPGEVWEIPVDDYTFTSGESFEGEGAFLHNADTLGGSSGALVFSESTHTVVGLHHGGSSVGNKARLISSVVENTAGFADAINDDIANHSVPPNNTDDDGDGYSENSGDCNDADTNIGPNATEYCNNSEDDDCDGNADSTDAEGCEEESCDASATSTVYLYIDGSQEATISLPSFSGSMEIQLGARNALYDNVELVADCETLISEDFEVDEGCFDAGSISSDGNPGDALSTGSGATYPQCSVSSFDPETQAWYLLFDSKPTSSTAEYETATGIQGTSSGMIQLAIDTNASGTGDNVSLLTINGDSESFSFAFDSAWHTFIISNYEL